MELYVGLDQAMSILEAPAAERAAALDKYPYGAGMPTPFALELALTYAEAERFKDAEKMFRNRYFEREEGGANVRQVYLETGLIKAMALVTHGQRRKPEPPLQTSGSPSKASISPVMACSRS